MAVRAGRGLAVQEICPSRTDKAEKIGERRGVVGCTRLETSLEERPDGNLATRVAVFDSPVKRNKVEFCRDERMLNVDGLFRKNDEQPNELTDAQIMQ